MKTPTLVNPSTIRLSDARHFIEALTGSPDTKMTFQTFDDDRKRRERNKKAADHDSLAHVMHGCVSDEQADLRSLNQQGAGIFVAINRTDLKGRAAKNVIGLRAAFIDPDGPIKKPTLEPSFGVRSRRGVHAYFRLKAGEDLHRFKAVQRRLSEFCGSDPNVADLPRVMRLPGFLHQKEEEPFLVEFVPGNGQRYSIDEILDAHPLPSIATVAEAVPGTTAVSLDTGKRVLAYLDQVPPAVAGRHGDDATFRAACKLVRGFNLSDDDALDFLLEWNTKCSPPWDAAELREKVINARAYGSEPLGYLLRTSDAALRCDDEPGGIVTVNAANVRPESVRWLWPSHIAFGKLTLLDGDPGLGKSTIAVDLVATLTRGAELPDGTRVPVGNALMVSGEDDIADTVVPRLKAADAIRRRVEVLSGVAADNGDGLAFLDLSRDTKALEAAITRLDAKLVVIDPIMAYLGQAVDSWKDASVRAVLGPLAALAAGTGAAILMIRHLNKNAGTKAMYRGGASIAFTAAARTAFLVAPDPEDQDSRVLAPIKSNISTPKSWRFRIVPKDASSRVEWSDEPCEWTADQLLQSAKIKDTRSSALGQATMFLRGILGSGPVEAKVVLKAAAAEGHSEKTIRRAQSLLHVSKKKIGKGPWKWSLPDSE